MRLRTRESGNPHELAHPIHAGEFPLTQYEAERSSGVPAGFPPRMVEVGPTLRYRNHDAEPLPAQSGIIRGDEEGAQWAETPFKPSAECVPDAAPSPPALGACA